MFHKLRKLNFKWNHKRVYRVYTLMRLNLRNKRRKRIPVPVKEPQLRPIRPNITWIIYFMHDTLKCGRKIRGRYNRTFRQEVLDSFLFKNVNDLSKFANASMWIYNNERPHRGLNNLTPHEFLLRYGKPYVQNIKRFPTFQQDDDEKNQWKYLVSQCS
jgi:hypothetical protein